MSWLRRIGAFGWAWVVIPILALSSLAVASYRSETWPWADRRPLFERYRIGHVSRGDLLPILNASGRLESSKRTIIRCQIENITGSGSPSGGASTLLTVLPQGTPVEKGEVLATFDGSAFEDMYQQQIITVEQAKTSQLQAQLNHEIALLAVNEFRDGTVHETLKGLEGSITLARADLARALDRLDWTRRMQEKGYCSAAQIVSDQHTVAQLKFSLERQLTSLDLFTRFTEPKTEKTLQMQVKAAETSLMNEELRLRRQLDRLAMLKTQLDRCTIRAPHDGVLYYTSQRNTVVESGMAVRQRQELFYLPDLSKMEVQVALNESIVHRVRPGLRATVEFEAVPDLVLEGRLDSISQIPTQPEVRAQTGMGSSRGAADIRYFMAIVKLDRVSPELRPGMTTRVDIALRPRNNVLTIPSQALKSERGKKFCFVVHEQTLEQRDVRIGEETTDLVEVRAGLEEGEPVALDPPYPRIHVEPLHNFGEINSSPVAERTTVNAAQR
jgi:HlyD family secretion protein